MKKKELILIKINFNNDLKKFLKKNIIFKKYLVSGIVNTLFAYFIGIFSFHLFYNNYGVIFVSFFNYVLCITFNFINFRFLVFKKKILWFNQYIKYFLSNFFLLIILTANLFFFIKILNLNIYLTQLILILLSIVVSFFINTKYIFK